MQTTSGTPTKTAPPPSYDPATSADQPQPLHPCSCLEPSPIHVGKKMHPRRTLFTLLFPLPRRLASLPATVFFAGRHDFTNQLLCPFHPVWMRSFKANPPLPPLTQVPRHQTMKKPFSLPSISPCLQQKLKNFARDPMAAAQTSISPQRSTVWTTTPPCASSPATWLSLVPVRCLLAFGHVQHWEQKLS